jgi:hypothetical protein
VTRFTGEEEGEGKLSSIRVYRVHQRVITQRPSAVYMFKNILTVLSSFVGCIILTVIFVLWTEYAYNEGVRQATYMECEADAGQVN